MHALPAASVLLHAHHTFLVQIKLSLLVRGENCLDFPRYFTHMRLHLGHALLPETLQLVHLGVGQAELFFYFLTRAAHLFTLTCTAAPGAFQGWNGWIHVLGRRVGSNHQQEARDYEYDYQISAFHCYSPFIFGYVPLDLEVLILFLS